jgi:hypothetical protein
MWLILDKVLNKSKMNENEDYLHKGQNQVNNYNLGALIDQRQVETSDFFGE